MIDHIIEWISGLISGHQMVAITFLMVLAIIGWCGLVVDAGYRAWNNPKLTQFEKRLNVVIDFVVMLVFCVCMFCLFCYVYHLTGNPSVPAPPHPPYPPDDWWKYGLPCVK